MRTVTKVLILSLAFSLAFFFLIPAVKASERSFDEVFSSYMNSSVWDQNAEDLISELNSMADQVSGYDLWKSLWDNNKSSEKRVANALKLVDELYPGSDLRRWNEIRGFWYPGIISKPLAAIDAVYVAAGELVNMDRNGSAWIARNMIYDLSRSSRARLYFMKTAPEEYKMIIEALESKEMNPVIGEWTQPDIEGKLPLAVRPRGYVDSGNAVALNYIFLNSSGQIASFGDYAWDRSKGRIYRVAHREDSGGRNIIYFPRP